MSVRKDFLRLAKERVGPKPRGVEVSAKIDAGKTSLPGVNVEYHIDDEAQQQWVFTVEERLGQEFEIWVRPL